MLKAPWSAQKVLRSGVTSISVPGGTWFTDVGVRDAIRLGVLEGPRVYCAGRMIITYGSIEDESSLMQTLVYREIEKDDL